MYRPNRDVFYERRSRPVPSKDGAHEPYICALCGYILDLHRPHQSSCGDRACYTCLEVLIEVTREKGIDAIECPKCHQPLRPSEIHEAEECVRPHTNEPPGLSQSDGKRPDGMSILPWKQCKSLPP